MKLYCTTELLGAARATYITGGCQQRYGDRPEMAGGGLIQACAYLATDSIVLHSTIMRT
jgi:hypothetical protein